MPDRAASSLRIPTSLCSIGLCGLCGLCGEARLYSTALLPPLPMGSGIVHPSPEPPLLCQKQPHMQARLAPERVPLHYRNQAKAHWPPRDRSIYKYHGAELVIVFLGISWFQPLQIPKATSGLQPRFHLFRWESSSGAPSQPRKVKFAGWLFSQRLP
ncbi:hypothetical protein F4680DRAFT_379992 [Xylaria scruposa]|nr:hypothetical protein F4680DRAFT_379992 [Xylaria scruposa]